MVRLFLDCYILLRIIPATIAGRGVDMSALPKEVRDQLAELDLELSEGKGLGQGKEKELKSCCVW